MPFPCLLNCEKTAICAYVHQKQSLTLMSTLFYANSLNPAPLSQSAHAQTLTLPPACSAGMDPNINTVQTCTFKIYTDTHAQTDTDVQ